MKVENYTMQMGLDLINGSIWKGRYFKKIEELIKCSLSENPTSDSFYTNLPTHESGQLRCLYHFSFTERVKEVLFEKAFDDRFIRSTIETILKNWGKEGLTYQEVWNNNFMEEMFMPVGWSPKATVSMGWFAGFIPPISGPYTVQRGDSDKEWNLFWKADTKEWRLQDRTITNVYCWKFKDFAEWNLGSQHPPSEGIYEVSFEGEVGEASWREYVEHPGGGTLSNQGPCFVSDEGYPMEVDWWREMKHVDPISQKLVEVINAEPDEELLLYPPLQAEICTSRTKDLNTPLACLILKNSAHLDREINNKHDDIFSPDFRARPKTILNDAIELCSGISLLTLRKVMNHLIDIGKYTLWNAIINDLSFCYDEYQHSSFNFDQKVYNTLFSESTVFSDNTPGIGRTTFQVKVPDSIRAEIKKSTNVLYGIATEGPVFTGELLGITEDFPQDTMSQEEMDYYILNS